MYVRQAALFFSAICFVGQTCATVWTFGNNNINFLIISNKSGQIIPSQRTTSIRLEEPPCMAIKFIQVTVNNNISNPSVTFDKHRQTVSISYDLLASSLSKYSIMTRGKRIRDCNKGNQLVQKGNKNGLKKDRNLKLKVNKLSSHGFSGGHGGAYLGGGGQSGSGGHGGGYPGGGGQAGNGGHGGSSGFPGTGGHGGGSGYPGGGGQAGNGGHGGSSGFPGTGGHGGGSGYPGNGGYGGGSGYPENGGHGGSNHGYPNGGGYPGGNGHVGNGGHGGGSGYIGGGKSIEIEIDQPYNVWGSPLNGGGGNAGDSDHYDPKDTDTGIYIDLPSDGTGKFPSYMIDSDEYGWGSYQFLNKNGR